MRCYVLSGGRSSRMGIAKESLKLGDRSFLERVIAAASAAFDEVVIVSRTQIRATVRTIIELPHDGVAPAFGVEAALEDALVQGDERLWIVAVDYPVITPEVLRSLRSQFERSDAEMLVPTAQGKPHMLCAGYSTSLLPRVREMLSRREFALRNLLQVSRAEVIPDGETDAGALRNVNTPADFESLLQDHEQAHASR